MNDLIDYTGIMPVLRDILVTLKPYDIATIFEELQDEKTPLLFRILPKSVTRDDD